MQSLCDSATVLRSGAVVAHCQPKLETPASLARMMIGTDLPPAKERKAAVTGPVRLLVKPFSGGDTKPLMELPLNLKAWGFLLCVHTLSDKPQQVSREHWRCLAGFLKE